MSFESEEMRRLGCQVGEKNSEILIGSGLLEVLPPQVVELVTGRELFVLTSAPILKVCPGVVENLQAVGSRVSVLEVPDGEACKTVEVAARSWNWLLERGAKRDSVLVALGGGSVGDLGGFVAATFLRGIELVQIPTTLLAQVDSSVGAKTAIDLPLAKNAVGAFYAPTIVVADSAVLSTLDIRDRVSGLVEAIKMAALLDVELFEDIEGSLEHLLNSRPSALARTIEGAISAKISIVEADPFEGSQRMLLNFGHTLGHAIEAAAGFSLLRHGEAIAYGLQFALRLSRSIGLPNEDEKRIAELLASLPLPPLPELDAEELLERVGRDKKARTDGIRWVLAAKLGEGRIVEDVPLGRVREELRSFLKNGQ